MSKSSKRRAGVGYSANFEKIFGNKAERKRKYGHEKEAKRLNTRNKSAYVPKDMESMKSPIDGSVITCRGKLREHNRKHGVTDIRDYGSSYFDRKEKERHNNLIGNTRAAKSERIETIKEVLNAYGVIKT